MLSSPNVLLLLLPALLSVNLGNASYIDVRASPSPNQKLLADGTGSTRRSGSINSELSWQATGLLYQGCNPNTFPGLSISDCYEMELSSDPTQNLDPGASPARQRNEFLTRKGAAGTSHKYSWKYYLASPISTNSNFFHLMQLLTRGDSGGPVITLDAVSGRVAIKDTEPSRGCILPTCPSIPLSDFVGKTTVHNVEVTYGDSGSFKYTVTDGSRTLLTYSVTGFTGIDASIKFGTYRRALNGMTAAHVAVGDFTWGS